MDAATTRRVTRELVVPITDSALGDSKQSKRIAIVASYAPSLIIFRAPLIRELKALGHDVLCAAPEIAPGIRSELEQLGAEVHEIPLQRTGLNPVADARTLRALRRLFQRVRPDIVLAYTAKPAIYGSIAARLANVPRIIPMLTGLGGAYLPSSRLKNKVIRPIMNALYRIAFASADGIIFHNKDDRAYLASFRTIPRSRRTYIVNGSGIDLHQFSRKPLPDTNNGLTFLMITRLIRAKGIEEYCRAAQSLKAKWPNARWRLVGPEESGANSLPLEELKSYGDAVDYLGATTDVRPALGACHVYVLPSYGEGMPRTVLEALAIGRPIITTDARGCRETVDPNKNGFLVPPGDSVALAGAMERFLENPEQLELMAALSYQIALDKFDVNRVNEEMVRALGV